MTDQQREKILEAACEVCHFPVIFNAADLDDFCRRCPVERAVDAAMKPEPEKKDGLRPCPFCGQAVVKVREGKTRWMYCPTCGACGPGWFENDEDAISAWNRRVKT